MPSYTPNAPAVSSGGQDEIETVVERGVKQQNSSHGQNMSSDESEPTEDAESVPEN